MKDNFEVSAQIPKLLLLVSGQVRTDVDVSDGSRVKTGSAVRDEQSEILFKRGNQRPTLLFDRERAD